MNDIIPEANIAGIAVEDIDARASYENVVAIVARELVISLSSAEDVIAAKSAEDVVGVSTYHNVVCLRIRQRSVLASIPIEDCILRKQVVIESSEFDDLVAAV